ncbi:MAG: FAD-dependent oxidoreductase [Acidobacteria bacterium]|nr:FAD-dependent oxidoreductase [Acidobacteriota bacterium]
MANILIVGGGFAGLVAAEKLAASVDRSHQITLVAPNRNFTFFPALVELALGECEAADIAFDLPQKLKNIGVRFVHGELIRISKGLKKAVITGADFNGEIAYDFLLIAIGRRLATEKVGGFFEHSHHILGVNAAARFGKALGGFQAGTIVVGMCPSARLPVPVCETAFALARRFGPKLDDGTIKIKVIFPESLSAAFGGADLHKQLESAFAKYKISVLYDVPVTEITPSELISAQKHAIAYDLLMLVPPFRGQAILNDLEITDSEDFVLVDDRMKVQGLSNTYAAGDIVAFSGPKFAHMAVRQAEVAAANIASALAGDEPNREYYHEIAAVIDAGGPESIYLHYGIWDGYVHKLKQGKFWTWAKEMHDTLWRARHR